MSFSSFKNPFTILRIGLALVFLANACVALFAPDEFRDVIQNSFVPHLFPAIPVSAFLSLVRFNDSVLFLMFLFNSRFIKYALVWASIWIILVIFASWDLLGTLEHMGFLSISIALLLNLKKQKN